MSLRAPSTSRGRGVAISLAKFQIAKSKLQTNPNIETQNILIIGISCFDVVQDLVLGI
jgi:hypothetical protein